MKKKLLNLGCGNHFHEDWVNVDFVSSSKNVMACDLNLGIPFPDNEFDVVYHSHLLEHFEKDRAVYFMKECYRVLKMGEIIRVAVPDLEKIARIYLDKLEKEEKDDYDWIMLELYDQTVRNSSGGNMYRYLTKKNIPNLEFVLSRIGSEGRNMLNAIRSANDPKTKELERRTKHENSFFARIKEIVKIGKFRLGGEVHQWMYDRFSLKRLFLEVGFKDVKVVSGYDSGIDEFSNYKLDLVENEIRKPDSLFMEAKK